MNNKYDIVMSFAGEDRSVAESIASHLVVKGINVFYDEYEKVDLWGKDLYSHLTKIYRDESKYCLMLISENYAKKQWTNHERRAAQSRAFSENHEYILPLKLDDTSIDGVLDTTGYLDFRRIDFEVLIESIVGKVHIYNKQNNITHNIVRVEDVLKVLDMKGGEIIRDKHITTECPTCESKQLLSEAPVSLDKDDTLYSCKNGCQTIVVVSRPGLVAWPGRGYRIQNYVLRNAKDLIIKTKNMSLPMKIESAKSSLMKKRPI